MGQAADCRSVEVTEALGSLAARQRSLQSRVLLRNVAIHELALLYTLAFIKDVGNLRMCGQPAFCVPYREQRFPNAREMRQALEAAGASIGGD